MANEFRDRSTQDQILRLCVERLRKQITTLDESTCFVSDQPEPAVFPSGDCVTVSMSESTFADWANVPEVSETMKLQVTPWIRAALDSPGKSEAAMIGNDDGLLRVWKPRILRALLIDKDTQPGTTLVWDPLDKDGNRILRDQIAPLTGSAAMPAHANAGMVGLILSFHISFDWTL